MATGSASSKAQNTRSELPQTKKAQTNPCLNGSKRLRKSPRTKETATERSELQATEEDSKKGEIQTIQTRRRTRDAESHTFTDRPTKRTRTENPPPKRPNSLRSVKKQKRAREVEVTLSPAPCSERVQAPVDKPAGVLKEALVNFWSEKGTWPTKEDESMDRFRELVENARAKKRALSRKRSNASMSSESSPIGSMSREQKCAPYRHQLFERQLKESGSFMDDHELGITPESENLCRLLLKEPQPTPPNTLFSDDGMFKKTCKRLKGENETKVVLRISQLIVPSAEILADQGNKNLAILRETTNACWILSMPFINPPGSGTSSRPGPRPQPDSALGFDRSAFNREHLRKLQPFLGDLLTDSSFFAATFQMYFPFLTCEVKCGDGGLDVADRQNAYSQSVSLLGLYEAFKLAGREKELHREINGFSISHNEEHIRIYGHYLLLDGREVQIYRHLIAKFVFAPSGEGDQRWKAYKFVKNIYDLWLPKHYERLCSVIDMMPDVSDMEQESSSLRSGLSQQLDGQSLDDANEISDSQSCVQQITPDATIGTTSSNSRKKKK